MAVSIVQISSSANVYSAEKKDLYQALATIKYAIVVPGYMPASFKLAKVIKEPNDDSFDYEVEFCDSHKNCCSVEGTEGGLGDPILDVGKKTLKKSVHSEVFGEVDLWLVTANEHQAWLDEDVGAGNKWPSYKKNVAETTWIKLKNRPQQVSYLLNCYGVGNDEALKILKGLKIL